MPRALSLAAGALILFAAAAPAQTPSPQRAIAPLFAEMLAAANAHNTDRFLANYLHDSTLVFVFDGVVTTGFDAVRANQLRAWQNGASAASYAERTPAAYLVLSPGAVVVTRQMSSARPDSTGRRVTANFAVTEVWEKRAHGWTVVMAHESTVRGR